MYLNHYSGKESIAFIKGSMAQKCCKGYKPWPRVENLVQPYSFVCSAVKESRFETRERNVTLIASPLPTMILPPNTHTHTHTHTHTPSLSLSLSIETSGTAAHECSAETSSKTTVGRCTAESSEEPQDI